MFKLVNLHTDNLVLPFFKSFFSLKAASCTAETISVTVQSLVWFQLTETLFQLCQLFQSIKATMIYYTQNGENGNLSFEVLCLGFAKISLI